MKKIFIVFVSVMLVITMFSGCSLSGVKSINTIEITEQNFDQYFEVSPAITDFVESEFRGAFLTTAYAKLTITITPKQTIQGGSVNVVLTSKWMGLMRCEYTDENYKFSMPVQFSPTQTYTKILSLSGTAISLPTVKMEIAEASGTIEV